MSWSDIDEYLAARAPNDHAAFEGVALADLEVFERETKLAFPGAYREFLLACGASCGDLYPFGTCWAYDFYQLAAVPPDEEFLADRLLRVGLFTDETAITPSDVYIDLGQDEREDSMLFDFEQDRLFDRQWLRPRGLSFLDTVGGGFFQSLQLQRYEHQTQLGVDLESGGERSEASAAIRETLSKLQLGDVLPASARLSTHASADVAALVEARETSTHVFVDLGSDDRAAVGRVAEVLLDNVSGLFRLESRQPMFEIA